MEPGIGLGYDRPLSVATLWGSFASMGWIRDWTKRGRSLGWMGGLVFAAVCVALATLVRIASGWVIGPTLPFATYFPAVLAAALVGGSLCGIAAIVLSTVVVWWAFTPPFFEFAALTLGQMANVALFAFSAGLIVWFAAVHRNLLADFERQEQQRELLAGEIQHRGKNILTIVESLIQQTVDDKDRGQSLINRIRAAVSTQDILNASPDRTADLTSILNEELSASAGGARARLDGPPVQFDASTAHAMRLVFHEFATNALKHGALSDANGKVSIDWRVNGRHVAITWREHGGPRVAAPGSYNFGSRLITRTLKSLGATLDPTFAETGYTYRITVPLAAE